MFKATQTHVGQYRRYGDFFREWNIETECTESETLEWCFNNLYTGRVPSSEEWHKEIRINGGHHGDYSYYFAGYYSILPIKGGYKFIVCEPYTD